MQIGIWTFPLGLMLAPMAGFTDAPMRALCRRLGAEYSVTEMVSAAALCFNDTKTGALAAITAEDSPSAVQLFGHDVDQMEEAARRIATGAYASCQTECTPVAIDLNMGCPVRKIVTSGDGSALMKTPALCGELVRAALRGTAGTGIPVTVKIRAGWDMQNRNAVEVALACTEAGASAICVHGRTREQMYAPSADWSIIRAVRDAVPAHIPVIGNGDVTTADDYFRLREETGCDGVAIGRAAMGDPWLFAAIQSRARGEDYVPPDESERRATALALAREIVARASSERAAVHECRGRCAHFLQGTRGAAALRARLHTAESLADLEAVLT